MSARWRLAQVAEAYWKYSQKFKSEEEYYRMLREHSGKILTNLFEVNLSNFKNKTLVEVGGGWHGVLPHITSALVRFNYDPLAIEGFRDGVVHYKKRGEDLTHIPKFANCVFCSNVLNHVDDDETVLRNIKDTLKEDGLLYFDVHIQPKSINHPISYTPESIEKLVSKYFKILHQKTSSTHAVFGPGDYENIPIWSCIATPRMEGLP